MNENVWFSLKISLKFVLTVQINTITALVQIVAWRLPGYKPFSEQMMVTLLTQICVIRSISKNHEQHRLILSCFIVFRHWSIWPPPLQLKKPQFMYLWTSRTPFLTWKACFPILLAQGSIPPFPPSPPSRKKTKSNSGDPALHLTQARGHLNWRMSLSALLGGNLGCRIV